MSQPITVIIPAHNRAPLLEQAIASVLASPLVDDPQQIIVVDDASIDATPEVARRFGVRYRRVVQGTPGGARNEGLDLATTEFVTFLDDDDVWLPGNMEPQLQALRDHPEAAYAYARVQMTMPDGSPLFEPFPQAPFALGPNQHEIIFREPPQIGTVLFRRSALAEQRFDPAIHRGEDGDLLVRMAARHSVVGLDFVGLLFRQRLPSKHDADARWQGRADEKIISARWRSMGIRIPRWKRISIGFRHRGLAAYLFCRDADAALGRGERRDAARYLSYALRLSAAHTLLRQPMFWSTLLGLFSPNGGGHGHPAPSGT